MASSRPYRITVRETLQKTVGASDRVGTRLELPPILPPAAMSGHLARVLGERGFAPDHGSPGSLSRSRDGVTARIDPATGEVDVSASGSVDLDLSDEGDLPGCSPCAERSRASIAAGLRRRLETQAGEAQRVLQNEVTDRLEGAIGELGCELERVANQVTASALKEKARSLGEIKQITQDPQTGSMTIVVAV